MKKLFVALILLLPICNSHAQDSRINVLQNLEHSGASRQDSGLTATITSATRLFGEKDDLTTVICIIPSDMQVDVIGSDSTYFHVYYEDYEGYIYRRHAILNKAEAPEPERAGEQNNFQEQEQQPLQQVSRFTYLESKYGTNMAARLAAGKIWKGMSSEMVRDSWGTPKKITRHISDNNVMEEWLYNNTWLYIDNDILSDWGPIR